MKDKVLIALFSLFAVALIAHSITQRVLAQSAQSPLNEWIVKTNPTNWLSATEIRFVPGKCAINRTTGLPEVSGTIEAWGEDVDSGVTNRSVLRRQAITLTQAQLNTWNSQTGTNGFAWLTSALLAKSKLTLRP